MDCNESHAILKKKKLIWNKYSNKHSKHHIHLCTLHSFLELYIAMVWSHPWKVFGLHFSCVLNCNEKRSKEKIFKTNVQNFLFLTKITIWKLYKMNIRPGVKTIQLPKYILIIIMIGICKDFGGFILNYKNSVHVSYF